MRRLSALLFLSFFAYASVAQEPVPLPKAPETTAKPFIYKAKPSDVVIGDVKAPVTIVEYASLSCPHCAHFFNDELPKLATQYIDTGKAKIVYRDYPINEPALRAAQLVQCVDSDSRHNFIKVLFNLQNKWAYDAGFKDALANIAALGGIGREKFDACMADKAVETAVVTVGKEGQDEYKINSTPTFFINGKLLQGDHGLEAMSKAIDDALPVASKK